MDEALLPHTSQLCQYVEELKRINRIAFPMIITTVGQYLLRVLPIFMLGNLGELQLSGVSIATSLPMSPASVLSTRVANELGAGNPHAAKVALYTGLLVSVSEFVLASTSLFLCRSILGYAFSNEKEVIDYVKHMTPLLCVSLMTDSTQSVLSGVARGSGWQHLGAYVNQGAYYLVGIPVALVLGFAVHLRGMGLWGGLLSGSLVQCVLLSTITALTNWEKQAIAARKRIFQASHKIDPVHICS